MIGEAHERALATFDAFLQRARETDPGSSKPKAAPAPTASALPDLLDAPPDESTDPSMQLPRVSNAPPNDTPSQPMERPGTSSAPRSAARPTPIVPANPILAAGGSDGFEDMPTRVSPISEAMAASLAPLGDESVWDEATRERQDVVQELRSQLKPSQPPPPPEETTELPSPPRDPALSGATMPTLSTLPAMSASIIVDEEEISQTSPIAPRFDRDASAGDARGAQFVQEMVVLMKYGHGSQVPSEIDRWRYANQDDLAGLFRVAVFELERVDAGAGVEALFTLASRTLDHGLIELSRDVLDRVIRAAPQDLRVNALRARVARQ